MELLDLLGTAITNGDDINDGDCVFAVKNASSPVLITAGALYTYLKNSVSTGTVWYTATMEPTGDIGANGDYCLVSDYNVYRKESGAWVLKFNIKGADGTSSTGCPDYVLQNMGVI